MDNLQQRTLAKETVVSGVGYIWGNDVQLRFLPAAPNSGISFVRTDLPGCPRIPATIEWVAERSRRTSLETGDAKVEMVEHVMAALAGLEIDNCVVEINAPETPGCDGSSGPFTEAILRAGITPQPVSSQVFEVDRPYWVHSQDTMLAIFPPSDDRLIVSYNLDYGPNSPIGRQSQFCDVTPDVFRKELAPARTFLLQAEADYLRAQGLGLRTSARDLLVFGKNGPIDNSLRYSDEPVRHKILDIVGDLALLGRRLRGHVVAHKSGHRLNAELTRLLADAVADIESESALRLDGDDVDITRAA